ncbi:MAG: alpha/beta hydrolase [Clostridia bacterium]|nr:alpha/beta hydrolase [Clostridia bacterium]
MFDGPSESDALIFYPGAKVEETAYAPLMRLIAAESMDVLLVRMPFRLAFFGADRAADLITRYDYDTWHIGGHSLGGVMAAGYAAEHSGQLAGVILLAAYPAKQLDDSLKVISIYGSADGVLNMKKLSESGRYMPENALTYVIRGGNHAQFGNYGKQSGDGEASVTAGEQQRETAMLILKNK